MKKSNKIFLIGILMCFVVTLVIFIKVSIFGKEVDGSSTSIIVSGVKLNE